MIMKLLESKAQLCYYNRYCVAYTHDDLAKYYLSLIPKAWYVQPQAFPAHLTVVRKDKEDVVTEQENWKAKHGEWITFLYCPCIHNDGTYFWLNCWSKDIGRIRKSLGLSWYRPGFNCYHLTIGNKKI